MKNQLHDLINEEYDISAVQAQRLKLLNGETIRFTALVADMDELVVDKLEDEDLRTYLKLSIREKTRLLVNISKKVYREQEQDRAKDNDSGYNIDISDYVLLLDVFDPESDSLIYDLRENCLSQYSTKKVESLVGLKQFSILDKYPCRFVYNPLGGPDSAFSDYTYGQDLLKKVNIYKHPEWRKDFQHNISPFSTSLDQFDSLPESARMFFNHLFPDKDSLNYALDWLYVALTSPQGNEHILVLNGPTGTGKTIFCSDLLIALVGESNWGTAPKNLFESTFNKVLLNKRIVFIDEARINERDYNTVKLYANKRLNVEKKGFDADNTSDLYFSMALSNNKIGNIFVDPDDRRFSIPETTDLKIKDALGEDFPGDFCEDLRDKDFVKQIGEFILNRYSEDDYFVLDQFKGGKFYKFVWRHLSQWQKVVCSRIFKVGKEEEDEIEVSTLVSAVSANKHIRYDVQPDTVVEFIQSYVHRGDDLLGRLEVDEEGDKILKINPVFVKGADVVEDLL